MCLIGYRCNKKLLILGRYRSNTHHLSLFGSHHLCHDLAHPLDLRGFNLRCYLKCICVKLFGSNSHRLEDLVRYQDGCTSLIIGRKNEAVYDRHVLQILMRNILQHLLVGLSRNNLHCELFLHLAVISKGIDVEVGTLVDTVIDGLDRLINHLIERSALVVSIIESLDPDVHADPGSFRSDRHRFVAFVKLLYFVYRYVHVGTLLVKTLLHCADELLFEFFIIHMFFSFPSTGGSFRCAHVCWPGTSPRTVCNPGHEKSA